MSSIALRRSSAIGGPLISKPSMWQLLSASAGHCNTCSHVTLENYTYMTLQHLLTCDIQTLASHVTVEHDTFMTLKHLHDTQTLERTSRNFMYSISTCVTLNTFTTKLANTILKCNPTTLHVISVSSFQVCIMTVKVKGIVLSPSIQKTLPQCTI